MLITVVYTTDATHLVGHPPGENDGDFTFHLQLSRRKASEPEGGSAIESEMCPHQSKRGQPV